MARGVRMLLLALAALAIVQAVRAQDEDDIEEEDLIEEEDVQADEVEATVLLAANKAIEFGDVSLLTLGTDFTVSYTLFNLGNSPAYGVELTDAWDTSSFKVVSGESTAAFKSIAAGESAKHTMVLRPLKEGVFTSTRANITYTTVPEDQPGDEEEPEYREALSSSDGLVQVVTSAEFRRRSGALTVEYLAVALLAAAVVVAPLLAANSASKRLSAPKRA